MKYKETGLTRHMKIGKLSIFSISRPVAVKQKHILDL